MDITPLEMEIVEADKDELYEILTRDKTKAFFNTGERGHWAIMLMIKTMEQDVPERWHVWGVKVQVAIRMHHVSKRDSEQGVISDEQLNLWERGDSNGARRAVPFLRELQPAERPLAVAEANTRMGMHGGWNFSGSVWEAVKSIKEGRGTPCLDANREMLEAEHKVERIS